ncbi:hypothetical protein D3C81_1647550 [compost metagenome]
MLKKVLTAKEENINVEKIAPKCEGIQKRCMADSLVFAWRGCYGGHDSMVYGGINR